MPHPYYLALSLAFGSLVIAPAPFANTVNCEAIATETVAELKAGAADWWSEDSARMAGMAAASACFKTQTSLAQSMEVAVPAEQATSPEDEATEFMGLEVRPLSGPPSRKPYERSRD